MKFITLTLLSLSLTISNFIFGQSYSQYFDDTISNAYELVFEFDTSAQNIWQIGPPQKAIFDYPASTPNVLVTDVANVIPNNNTSSFQYSIGQPYYFYGVLAIQFKQKLDLDTLGDYAKIEFSIDNGATWSNAFDNPYVYNFYGYDEENVIEMQSGEKVFSGLDYIWKDIWLCFDASYLVNSTEFLVRHTLVSDSINNSNEGWMLDNFLLHQTIIHTINETEQLEYVKLSPNPSNGKVEISVKKLNEFHIIEEMELMDELGRVMKKWQNIPTKFFIEMHNYADGIYYLKVKTNKKSETVKLVHQN